MSLFGPILVVSGRHDRRLAAAFSAAGAFAFLECTLAEAAADFAHEVLAPGGAFLCKVLQGGTEATLLAGLKRDFSHVKHVKPAASRPESAELYLLATGFRGVHQPLR